MGLPFEEKILLYAGRLIELKGVQDLIAAYAQLREKRPAEQLRLLIVGDGPYREELYTFVNQHNLGDWVEFRDVIPIEQMPKLMSACDMLVLPSRKEFNEQFGRVNAETMLCGTTVVGSTSGAIPKVLGEGGFIFTAGDVENLLATLEYVLDHPGETADKKLLARRFALEQYSTGATVEKLRILIDELSKSMNLN